LAGFHLSGGKIYFMQKAAIGLILVILSLGILSCFLPLNETIADSLIDLQSVARRAAIIG
jgi:hypothetical protein